MTEELWSDFVASEITPRFPAGLTVDDALGQRRDAATGKVIKEPSKELQLIVPAEAKRHQGEDRRHSRRLQIALSACASF